MQEHSGRRNTQINDCAVHFDMLTAYQLQNNKKNYVLQILNICWFNKTKSISPDKVRNKFWLSQETNLMALILKLNLRAIFPYCI